MVALWRARAIDWVRWTVSDVAASSWVMVSDIRMVAKKAARSVSAAVVIRCSFRWL